MGVRRDDHRNPTNDLDSERAKPVDLRGVVRHQLDALHAEVLEHVDGGVVLARVVRQTEQTVRIDRVVPLLLQFVRADLVREADASALLTEVEPVPTRDQLRRDRFLRRARRCWP